MPTTGVVHLPLHLKWSGPRVYDLDDPSQRRAVYKVVLVEGNSADIREYIDPDQVLALWDDMFLPRRVRAAWRDWFARCRGIELASREAFGQALDEAGIAWEVVRRGPNFARLRLEGDGGSSTLVDLGYDYRLEPPGTTSVGATLTSRELAADKLLALFGRAQARDFVDVYRLAAVHGIDAMLQWAKEKDTGLDLYQLAVAIGSIDEHPRDDFPIDEAALAQMEDFFSALRADLIDRSLNGP